MKKNTRTRKLLSMFIALMMLMSALTLLPVSAATPAQQAAELLYSADLFRGVGDNADGSPDFALNSEAKREQALVMLIRLTGMETTALADYEAGEIDHPFADVPEWFAPYAAFGYSTGLTNGISETAFGVGSTVTATQYLTFVLRALNYNDGTDFQWDEAWLLTDELGITDGTFNEGNNSILRGDMALISAAALVTEIADTDDLLIETLLSSEAVTLDADGLDAFIADVKNITAATDTTRYIVFTSDTHYNKDDSTGENPFRSWMDHIATVVDSVDYMAICGDLASAYISNPNSLYWENTGALMALADEYVESGFVLKKNLFLFGNHEWWAFGGGNYPENKDNEAAKRLLHAGHVEEGDGYVLYSFSPNNDESEGLYGNDYGAPQNYTKENIDALGAYLETAPKDIPVFVMAHYPIHTYSTPESTEDRRTGNAEYLIETLNNYPNVIFLWGHNHSSADPYYDTVFKPGDEIKTGTLADIVMSEINFYYVAAGCMSDIEYRSSPESTSIPGGSLVRGKGLLAAVNGSEVSLTWYDKNGDIVDSSETITIG